MRDGASFAEVIGAELGRGVLWAPGLMAAGILGYFAMPLEPALPMIAAAALCCAVCAGCAGVSAGAARAVLWAALWISLGFAVAGLRSYVVAAPVLDWRYYGPVEGRVAALDRSASGALRVTLEPASLGRRTAGRTPRRVRLSLYGPDADTRPVAGAWVMTTAHLSPPSGPAEPGGFDFQRHAWFQGLGAVGYTRVALLTAAPPEAKTGFFALRLALSKRVRTVLAGQTGAFAAALMTGDRSGLSLHTLDNLRRSNLAHLLAISGLHMGLLAGFVFGALRLALVLTPWVRLHLSIKKWAAAGGLIAAVGYLGLSGGTIATERAFIMVAVALGAVMLGRRAISLRSVALAAVIILVHRPDALLGPGFQMSFAATTALVATFNAMGRTRAGRPRGNMIWRFASGAVLSSAVAGLATLPIAAAHFNQIAHFGLVANVLSVPLMGAMIMPLAVLSVCAMPFGLEAPVVHLMGFGLDWILQVAAQISTWPGSVSKVPAPPGWAFACLCAGLFVMAVMASRLRWTGVVPVLIALAAWTWTHRPDVLIADSGSLVGVMTPQGRAVSKPKGAGFVAQIWLENDGDPADQYQSAARWPEPPGIARVGAVQVHVASGKRGLQAFGTCARGDIVVFSETQTRALPCGIFDAERLRKTGSVALWRRADGTLRPVTARQLSGRRLWNDAGLRKRRLGHQ